MKRNGNSAFSFFSRQITNQKNIMINFMVKEIIISFKKYFKRIHGQSVLEYSLLLIVIAVASLLILGKGIIRGNPTDNPFRGAVDNLNTKVTGDPTNLINFP